MASFAPFEDRPRLAVAVSGGPDSLALALLAAEWAHARSGGATAITVDHRLRPDFAAEAAQVATWLGRRGVPHVTLERAGAAPSGDIQAAARSARYRLLEAWCAGQGVLHLLTAHHREDQAETLLLRLARGSGLDGLAGMSALVEHAHCRVLRPLLGLPRARLAATLAARGQDWIDDPSNRNPIFARARLRQAADVLAEEGLTAERLADTASRLGRARQAIEPAVVASLARAAWLHPAGFAWLDPATLSAASEEIRLRSLAALLACVGGTDYPPRLDGLDRLARGLARGLGSGRTLGGCLVLPRRGRVLVCREPAAVAAPIDVAGARHLPWDGRFLVDMRGSSATGIAIGALGADAAELPVSLDAIPAAARPTLPALRVGACVIWVPHLGYRAAGGPSAARLRFRPARPLTAAAFLRATP